MNRPDLEEQRPGPARLAALRRLNVKITFLLVVSFLLTVALFLSILLPFQQSQRRRFIDDRRRFLDVLVEARRGDVCKWWIQRSVAADWHEFQKTILVQPNVLHATLYYADAFGPEGESGSPPVERLAVTSNPGLVERTRRAARAAGVSLVSRTGADESEETGGYPLLAADGDQLWLRTPGGAELEGKLGAFRTPVAPAEVTAVEGASATVERDRTGARFLNYCALIYLGDRRRETFRRVGHLLVYYSLADLDAQDSAVRSLFYGLLGALFLVLLGLLNLSLGRSVVRPIRGLLEGMRRAGSGDLEVQLARRSQDEIGLMADRFNQMVRDLKRSKEAIEEHSRTLESRVGERTAELMKSEQRARRLRDHLSAVLGHVQAGVFALDAGGRIVTFTERSGELLELDPDRVRNRPAAEVLDARGLEPLSRLVARSLEERSSHREELRLGRPGKVRTFQAAVTTLAGGGMVVVLDDVTDLVYSKRLLAWREAVERVIHDIKNPLTPVRLSAQQMRVAYEDRSPDLERIIDRGTANILSSVDSLQTMLADFSLLYRRPRAEPRTVDVNGLVEKILEEQSPAVDRDVTVVKTLAPDLPPIQGDPLGLWRLVTNVIQNGLEVMRGRRGRFRVVTEPTATGVRLTVSDDGPGIPPERLDKLFEPYFTTKAKGTGLGLVIARQIVEDHGGTIEIRSEMGHGTTAQIDLPRGEGTERPEPGG